MLLLKVMLLLLLLLKVSDGRHGFLSLHITCSGDMSVEELVEVS